MTNYDDVFSRLAKSSFRRRMRLNATERAYVTRHGMDTIRKHAAELLSTRIFAEFIPNDGRQTPMHGHPVFVAQHATGTCCRGCIARWHGISRGMNMTPARQEYIINVIMEWISRQMNMPAPPQRKTSKQQYLF